MIFTIDSQFLQILAKPIILMQAIETHYISSITSWMKSSGFKTRSTILDFLLIMNCSI